ncbi:MAG TPA: dihydrodipicolinate synthase family protein, partial [Ferruginibacter sp.]|nr:dihydrodipicolinate synthase family protein [Ferruginibacter sp.]
MSIRQQITGTGVAIITPFDQTESVDYEALGRVIDFIIAGGIEYIVTLGTTGETPVLSKEEKADIIRYTLEKVNRRVPVIVGIGGNNTRAVAADMQSLPLEGALAVLSASPYYNKPSQEGIYQHFRAIAENTDLPIILYNVPGRCV